MGYWVQLQKRDGIEDLSGHPWAELLLKTMEQVQPQLVSELRNSNELDAYLSVKVDECTKSTAQMQQEGMDASVAEEIALSDLLPSEQTEPEDWEIEGAESDVVAAFTNWILNRKSGRSSADETK